MPDFLVGSGKTYATIQAGINAVAALGDLAGLGDHNIIVDENFVTNGSLDFSALLAKVDGQVIIKSASGFYFLEMASPITPTQYVTLQDFEAIPNVGFSSNQGLILHTILVGETTIRNFRLKNPNNVSTTAMRGGARARLNAASDGVIYGFLNACVEMNTLARITVNNSSGQGIVNNGTVTDCAVVGSASNDFSGNTTVSYCASEDLTATGTGSITGINPLTEFVDAANGNYLLAPGSQLIAAGSTGNNIGWDQTEVNVAPVLDTPQADTEIQEGQVGTINLGANFSDANTNEVLTFSISPNVALVTGFTFDTATGIISYSGTQVAAAGVNYTVTATDSGGLTASDTFILTVVPPKLTIGTISDTTPEINTQITVNHTNAQGLLTTPNFNIANQTGTQFVLDISDITTLVLAGQTFPTINFNTPIAIPISDGVESDNVDLLGILNPAGTATAEITSIDPNGVYANDTGVVVGMFGYFFNVVGNLTIFPESGVILSDGNGGSCQYKLYNGEWGSAATVTINAVEPEPDVTPPVITLNGANPLEWTQGTTWVDPGATVTDNIDATRQINADTAPNINTLGQQVIAYNAQDAAGNAATQVTRTVNVVAIDTDVVVVPPKVVENPANKLPDSIELAINKPYNLNQHMLNPNGYQLAYSLNSASNVLPNEIRLSSSGILTSISKTKLTATNIILDVTIL